MKSRNARTEGTLRFLEAAYAWERSDGAWLNGVVDAAVHVWGETAWAFGLLYDASDVRRFRFDAPVPATGLPAVPDPLLQRLTDLPPEFVRRTYRTMTAGFTRTLDAHVPPMFQELEDFGTVDVFGINALDPSGLGCGILIGSDHSTLAPETALMFSRLSAHLSSAYRCRRRLKAHDAPEAEAILDQDGRVLDSHGPARTAGAQAALRRTALAIRTARARGADVDTLTTWPPRVRTRWTLVDSFSQDGQRYILARENLTPAPELDALTERERQVVACAAVGRTNKEIAYELGISHATTRVLLARASARLGVRARDELLALPCVRSLVGDGPHPPPPSPNIPPPKLAKNR